MNLQDLSLIAQIVGVVLVPASLVFVGLQMRQTHTIERGNAQRDVLNQTREWWMQCVADEATFDLFSQGLATYATLDRYRQARFNALGWSLMHIVEGVFFQHRAGLINASSHEGYVLAFLSIVATPGGGQWWAEVSDVANREFPTYVSLRLAAEAGALPLWTEMLPFFRLPVSAPVQAEPRQRRPGAKT